MQSVLITTKVVSSNPTHDEVISIQLYVIKFVSDIRQVGGFLRVLQFPPPIKLTVTIYTEILLKVALNTINLTITLVSVKYIQFINNAVFQTRIKLRSVGSTCVFFDDYMAILFRPFGLRYSKRFFLFIWLPFQSFLMQVQYTLAFAGVRLKHKKKVYGIIIIYVSHRVYSEKKHLFFIIMEISRVCPNRKETI